MASVSLLKKKNSKSGDLEAVLTLQEAAKLLRLSEMTILRLASRGRLPGAKIGRQWRFSRESILAMIKNPKGKTRHGNPTRRKI